MKYMYLFLGARILKGLTIRIELTKVDLTEIPCPVAQSETCYDRARMARDMNRRDVVTFRHITQQTVCANELYYQSAIEAFCHGLSAKIGKRRSRWATASEGQVKVTQVFWHQHLRR